MADWKNVHLAEQDERIAELELERAECQHELVALRYTLDDLVAHQRRRAEVAEAHVRELEATIDAMTEAHAHDDMALTAAYLGGVHEGKKQAEAERDALREQNMELMKAIFAARNCGIFGCCPFCGAGWESSDERHSLTCPVPSANAALATEVKP